MAKIIEESTNDPSLNENDELDGGLAPDDYVFIIGADGKMKSVIFPAEESFDYHPELLKILIEERNLKQKDLTFVFKTESIVSDILKGKRKLNKEHIQKLADFFNISPAVFFPRQKQVLST
jgi:HTH-type transcriptional regulator/antitoxin HigA